MKKNKQGFTLIELMIVVAIIGILAAVAIPAFLRFIKKSKTSEAGLNIAGLKNGAISWYNGEHSDASGDPLARHFPSTDSPQALAAAATTSSVPDALPCLHASSRGALFAKNTQRWNVQPWLAIKFSITKAHYFQYTYIQSGSNQNSEFAVIAEADLDCDGTTSHFEMKGVVNATSGEVETTNVIIDNELE